MSKEYLKHIFEPFSQERNDSGSTQQGIGLGMSIVKGLIEKMGGTIKIKSEEGIGSTFIIRISFKLASAPEDVYKRQVCLYYIRNDFIYMFYAFVYFCAVHEGQLSRQSVE